MYTTLKHKTLPGIYGSLRELDGEMEIWHTSLPTLMNHDATIAVLKVVWGAHNHPALLKQIDDYEIVPVNIIPGLTAIDIAKGLFDIHRHDPSNYDESIYRESELLQALQAWGLPAPDWDGYSKQVLDDHNRITGSA